MWISQYAVLLLLPVNLHGAMLTNSLLIIEKTCVDVLELDYLLHSYPFYLIHQQGVQNVCM